MITEDSFIKFYIDAAKNNSKVVWANLSQKHVSKDLILYAE